MSKPLKILVSGGGTGGHIFPAIAIANAIKALRPDTEFLFIGAKGKMEMEKVPAAGYKIEGLTVAGFNRKNMLKNISFPFKLIGSLMKARRIVKRFNPDVAVGTGGYASGPALKAAGWLKIKTVLQEQNALPSVTNRLLAKKAERICVAFEGMEKYFPASKIRLTGNPIRDSITKSTTTREDGAREFGMDPNKPTVFITGGSLGARAINKGIIAGLEKASTAGIQMIWQCGKYYLEECKKQAEGRSGVHVTDFITSMEAAYAAADVIVSRAGGTISELAVIGKPCILLPSPNVAEDHQTKNVMALVKIDAAILVKDDESETRLMDEIIGLLGNENRRRELSDNIKTQARPNASMDIATEVLSLVK